MGPRVCLVVTEHRDYLSADTHARYEAIARTLEDLGGGPCETTHYLDALPDADTLVLTGSYAPWAVHDDAELEAYGERLIADPRPALGVCAGFHLLARFAGGRYDHMSNTAGEQGFLDVEKTSDHPALAGLPRIWQVFQQHSDEVVELPDSLELVASSPAARVQAFIARDRPWWGTQFHPERYDAAHPLGRELLVRFLALTA